MLGLIAEVFLVGGNGQVKGTEDEVFAKLQKEENPRVRKAFRSGTPRDTRIAVAVVAGRVSEASSQLLRE